MLDIKLIEQNPSEYKEFLKNRKGDPAEIDTLLEKSKKRRDLIAKTEELKAKQNSVSKDIPSLKKQGKNTDDLMAQMTAIKEEIKKMEVLQATAQEDVDHILLRLPNKLHSSVPVGTSEADNKIVRTVGEKGTYSFKPQSHDDLGTKLQVLDFERAAKVTGSRFCFLRKEAALLERALQNFMLDLHTQKHGYEECMPPLMANDASFQGTGQFPKFIEDVFHIEGMGYHLIPTAEVPVTNFYAGEILEEANLPQKMTAFTPCFRSEAGSHGRDTKGLIRQHQFNKVEMVQFVHPDKSYEAHEELTGHAEEVLKQLELHYEVAILCSGDIGFGAAKCHDINVWLPGQNAFREISSCSNFEDFQARRANIRFRPNGGGKPQFVHTLNGSGLAVGRTLLAIFENYQQEDGSVQIPKVLQKYTNGLTVIKANK